MPRFVTRDGRAILARVDSLLGDAEVDGLEIVDDGRLELIWGGSTEVSWDSQDAEMPLGEVAYLVEGYDTVLAGDLLVEYDDGRRERYRLQDGDVEPPRPANTLLAGDMDQDERFLSVLRYARWIVSAHAGQQRGTLTPEAFRRIRARAVAYAKQAGLEAMLESVLVCGAMLEVISDGEHAAPS